MKKYILLAIIAKFFILIWPIGALADTSLHGRWLDYYEEGDSTRISRGVSVVTQKPNERAGGYIKTGLWTWNMKDSAVSFRVKVSDWNKASVVTLVVGNGLKFSNAATFDIRRRFVGSPNDEWVEAVIPPSAWSVDGDIDWENIDSVLFSVMDTGESRITAQIANIKVVPMQKQAGRVTITVDDGLIDTMVMQKLLADRGVAGTAFVDVAKIDQPGYITTADMNALVASGWDIGGHNIGRLSKMTAAERADHVDATAKYLAAISPSGSKLYALPNGERNTDVNADLSTKFTHIFNIDGMSNDAAYLIPTNVNRHSIDKHTSLALAKKWVDDAKTNGEWVIINFHTFSDTWVNEEDWSVADVTALLDYIKELNVAVQPISAVLK